MTTKKGRDKLKKDKKPRTKRVNNKTTETTDTATISTANTVEEKAINAARTYLGTKWKYAGNDKKGIDCSGLICTSYKAAGKTVPRTTWTLKEATKEIDIKKVKKGDLLFFATGSNKKRLNHVGLVVNVTPAEIQFIHASTSKGVIISSLNQPFWLGSYLSAGRL